MPRSFRRTDNPKELAEYLSWVLSESALYAERIGELTSLGDIRNVLEAIEGQLTNTRAQVVQSKVAIDDAIRYKQPVEWDVYVERAGSDL